MRPFVPPLVGTALAVFWSKLAIRERVFTDYCSWYDRIQPASLTLREQLVPPSDLQERIRALYGLEFVKLLDTSRNENLRAICHVLYKKATIRYWFSDPVKILEAYLAEQQ